MSKTSGDNQRSATREPNHYETETPSSSSARPIGVRERAPYSLVEYCGSGTSHCGYCKRDGSIPNGRHSYDMRAYRLASADYQMLLDRGWRRSGTYCYHPINMRTCCPNYPISCEAIKFELSRSQRRCIQNLNSYLVNGFGTNNEVKIDYHECNEADLNQPPAPSFHLEELKKSPKARKRRFLKSCQRKSSLLNISLHEAFNLVKNKHIKRRKLENLSLEHYLYPTETQDQTSKTDKGQKFTPKHSLEIHLYQVDSAKCKTLRNDAHKIMQRYQHVVHKESLDDWDISRFKDFLVVTPLMVEPMQGFNHTETCDSDTKSIKLPLTSDRNSNRYLLVRPPELPTCYGTYHCVYQLDDKLIAVGVLDILPKCVTTVYFFYDPSYGHLNLGIYSALVEISLVRQLNEHFVYTKEKNKLMHYYMGFYVHECSKMHYKTTFRPSYLLCSETCKYVPTDICLSKLIDGKKYARFSNDQNEADSSIYTSNIDPVRILDIPIATFLIDSYKMRDYLEWAEKNLESDRVRDFVDNFLVQYVRLVGPKLVPKIRLLLR